MHHACNRLANPECVFYINLVPAHLACHTWLKLDRFTLQTVRVALQHLLDSPAVQKNAVLIR